MPDHAGEIPAAAKAGGATRAAPLRGRVALVTGSTRGIGLGIVAALREAGCHLMLYGRGEGGGAEAERLARRRGPGRVCYAAADLREPGAAAALLAACEAELGMPDILVNNAGIQQRAPVTEFPAEGWDRRSATHLSAPFFLIQAFARGMI